MKKLIDKLAKDQTLSKEEFIRIISGYDKQTSDYLFEKARAVRHRIYGHDIYIRGLIEFTNYCKNNCYYCGIRCGNKNAQRYRLSKDDIMFCCRQGYKLGMRTFVLQGGEDPYFSDDRIVDIIRTVKSCFPDCAVTLSIGEKTHESYQAFFDAGADRYLLRHETADSDHYSKLHPEEMSLSDRIKCLYDLKSIGYQVGCGFMVGSPYQTVENLADDLLFIRSLQPDMVGIGPFIPHHHTPFREMKSGTVELTVLMLGLIRLMLPDVLLPSTTALGTIDPMGREYGILAGANVIMPNLSPEEVRNKYMLYDNKLSTGGEAAENIADINKRMNAIGYNIVVDRGNHIKSKKKEE